MGYELALLSDSEMEEPQASAMTAEASRKRIRCFLLSEGSDMKLSNGHLRPKETTLETNQMIARRI